MRSTVQELEGLLGLCKGELPVNHRPDLVLLVELHHLLEPVLRAVENALESNVPPQCQHVHVGPVIRLVHLAGEISNAVDETAKCDTIEALFQGLRAAGLEDNVCAVVVGVLHHSLFPVGGCAVVDGVVCSELLGLSKFFVGRGSNDHYSSLAGTPTLCIQGSLLAYL